MARLEELVNKQKAIGEKIETIIRNYKKDSSSRKTTKSYFLERLKRLEEEWSAFEANDNEIRLLKTLPLDHEYFVKGYYEAVRDIVEQYQEVFQHVDGHTHLRATTWGTCSYDGCSSSINRSQ